MKKSMFMKIYIIPMIILSPMMMTSCNSWFSIWMIIELNLMSFIPMIIFFNKFYKELSMKYFIIQAISSSMLIISSNLSFTNKNMNLMMMILMNLSLFMKLGSPPFHNWFINLMNNMNWMNCFTLSTWQKIIPMISIMYLNNKYFIYLMSILSVMTSTIFGLNHQSIRIIFSYSSINHMSWMFLNLMINENMWMFYFISYTLINSSIILLFHLMNIFFINQLFIMNLSVMNNMFLFFNFMSMSGLPPTFGFIMKWTSSNIMNMNLTQMILLTLMILSMLSFLFYTRICINLLLNFKLMNKLNLINKFNTLKLNNNMIFLTSFTNLWILSIWIF